jgi:hypothetical protein
MKQNFSSGHVMGNANICYTSRNNLKDSSITFRFSLGTHTHKQVLKQSPRKGGEGIERDGGRGKEKERCTHGPIWSSTSQL